MTYQVILPFQSTQHDLVKIAPMAALTGSDVGKSSLSRSAYPDPKSRYDLEYMLLKIVIHWKPFIK